MAQVYTLGGRYFDPAAKQVTFAQRGFVMGTVRANGIDKVITRDGDVLGAILDSGCAAKLLAGLLTEDGRPWTREDALANATHFDGLTEDADIEQLLSALESLLAGFFVNRGSSSTASPTSSAPAARKTRRRTRPAVTPPSDSATGPTSAPPSPSTPTPDSTP